MAFGLKTEVVILHMNEGYMYVFRIVVFVLNSSYLQNSVWYIYRLANFVNFLKKVLNSFIQLKTAETIIKVAV